MATVPTPDPVSPALITTLGPSARRRLRIGARIALIAPLLVALGACTQMASFVAKPEPRPKDAAAAGPQVAAKPAAPAEVEPGPIPQPQEKPKPGKLYEWDGGDRKLTRIIVNTDEQKARFYVGDEQVGWTTVASGLSSHPTPVGHFEVLEKSANKRSNLYGKVLVKGGRVLSTNAKAGRGQFPSGARFEGASMPYYLRITYDGVGLHAGPIPRPGHPASHGCIRLPAKLAPVLFEHVGVGTQVSVVGSGPDYGNYAAKQRAYAAERLAQAQERKEVEARVRAQAAASDATLPAPGPAEPVIAMAEPAERPAPSPIAKPEPAAAPRPEPASRTLETPRERAPAAAPRRTAEATVSRPRPVATRARPARAVGPAVALAANTPSQASPAAVAPDQDQPQAAAPDAVPPPVAAVPAPTAPTAQPAPAPAEPPPASPSAVAAATPPSPPPTPAPAPAAPKAPEPVAKTPEPVAKTPEPVAKAPQVAAEPPAAPAAAPVPAQPPAATADKAAGG